MVIPSSSHSARRVASNSPAISTGSCTSLTASPLRIRCRLAIAPVPSLPGRTVYRDSACSFARLQAMTVHHDKPGRLPESLRPGVSRWFDRLEEAHGAVDLAGDVEERCAASSP